MKKMIEANNLKFAYPAMEGVEPKLALKGVSMEVQQGEFIAVLGHNGSGKSTFAKHINVLLRAQEGTLKVVELDAADEGNVWKIRSYAGMVFQNPDNQLVSTVVEEDVAFGPENLGVPHEELRGRVEEALEAVGMQGFEKRAPHMLSGGQKQRIAIAGVLAMHPDIIVFDEPTAMLDPQGRGEVMETIRYLNQEQGKTIILITHYMEEASEADRVFVMTDGVITDQGTPREVFSHQEILEHAGLTPPLATQVYYDLKEKGVELGMCPVTLKELVNELCR